MGAAQWDTSPNTAPHSGGLSQRINQMTLNTEIVPFVELSDAEIDAVSGGQTIALLNVIAQVSANVAAANLVAGILNQTTGDQTVTIGG